MKDTYFDKTPIISQDGSHTLFSKRFGEHYHSSFGAIQESSHIFIQAALSPFGKKLKSINLFEVGFGTGLNALLAYQFALQNNIIINYYSVEAFPVNSETVWELNYPELIDLPAELFLKMHSKKDSGIVISDLFNLTVYETSLQALHLPENLFDVVFFDAFSPESQPEMWSLDVFNRIYSSMKRGGVLTTYSSKGIVKRALKAAGFYIKKLPGPPGKREFVRAVKE
jgi:tRNA U34 5-methylaminomethyl-2-thiouridine-forming methyltransferase MnmC